MPTCVMRTIRAFEERLHVEFATGEIPGFVHLYAGEEASAAGVMAHLDDGTASPPPTGHGRTIAKGVDVYGMMAEIYGKKTGVCHGKGGSMHIADLSKGMLGANASSVPARRWPPAPPRPPSSRATAPWPWPSSATGAPTRAPCSRP